VRAREGPREARGEVGAGHGERGQRAVGGRWGEPAGHHPAQRRDHRGDGAVGVAQPDGRDERHDRMHAQHRRAGEQRGPAVLGRVQQHHQIVQRELPGGQCDDGAQRAAGAFRRRDEHGREQGREHHEQAEFAHRAAARDVADAGEQRAEGGEHRGPEHAGAAVLDQADPHGHRR
jgi:hypothetical protein